MQIGPQEFHLFRPPHAAGADPRCRRASASKPPPSRVTSTSRIGRAFQHGGQREAGLQHGGQVLQAVDRDVDGPVVERLFEFLDEDALVEGAFGFGHLGERDIGAAVAGGFDDTSLETQFGKPCGQGGFGGGGLDQRQFAAARANREQDG